MIRSQLELLPTFTAELEEIRKNGDITVELLQKIIQKHLPNSDYNRRLYKRYMAIAGGVPIYDREPRYDEENPINNKVANDFFSEIIDFKVGYFAGEPIVYSYSKTKEAEEFDGETQLKKSSKALTDFTTRNNMFGVDMETTKNASIYGYSGRLFYIDKEGDERVMPVHGFETIILSDTNIAEPEYAIRYYKNIDINGAEYWTAEFYDDKYVSVFRGSLLSMKFVEKREHLFDFCPLQGVANNAECLGDAEKVLSLIDDYDKVVSDNSNELESFTHAMLLITLNADDEVIKKAQKSGALVIPSVGTSNTEPVKWLTKSVDDGYTEHHLSRLKDNIYRFSRTPNLSDDTFGSASGVSLKFKLHGLETKCATFEASVMNSAQYMWKVLCSSWAKKGIKADSLQIVMEFTRNFPLDKQSEAQTAQAFIGAGLPKEWVYSQISGIDDVDYIMDLIEGEKGDITTLYDDTDTNAEKDEKDSAQTAEDTENEGE